MNKTKYSNISSSKSSTDQKTNTRIYNTIYVYYKIHSCKPVFFKDTHTSEVTLNARGETKQNEGSLYDLIMGCGLRRRMTL